MKTVFYTEYGGPEVLEIKDTPKPIPSDDEILVKVHAASVQQTDIRFRTGTPFLARVLAGLLKPKNPVLGCDYSGEVDAVGKNINDYLVGDLVYGALKERTGTQAEYIKIIRDEASIKPTNISHVEAASVGVAGTMALIALRDHAEIKSGQRVLVNGASGGIGSFAVQLAKYFGAEVTGVCSGANVDLVKSLGADHVIDYTVEDFTKKTEAYDIIFDAVRKKKYSECKNALTQRGIYVTTEFGPSIMIQMRLNSNPDGKRMKGMMGKTDPKDMAFLTKLIESGEIKPVIDRVYPLEKIAEAHQYVEKGHAKGRVIIRIVDDA